MTIYKTTSNGYCIEKRKDDYLFKRFYIGYTLAQAKKMFREDFSDYLFSIAKNKDQKLEAIFIHPIMD